MLRDVIDSLTAEHAGLTGIHALVKAEDAFSARLSLIDAARESLDVQYYIWRQDHSGTVLFDAARRAAARGVRVRILLDDLHTSGMDSILGALTEHRFIEVRQFNAFRLRRLRLADLLFSFRHLNRRMHNKTLIVDGRVVIIGGRNLGDDYFPATNGTLFSDLDVLAIGIVVEQAVHLFEQYWGSTLAVNANKLLRAGAGEHARQLAADAHQILCAKAESPSELKSNVDSTAGGFHWARAELLGDGPCKAGHDTKMSQALLSLFGQPQKHLLLVASYFVPSRELVDTLTTCARRGVDVQVVTNAFEATDVAVVHAAYSRRRKTLLTAGVRLYELRSTARTATRQPRRRLSGGSLAPLASARSLHAKVFSMDGVRLFVGSFNLDPRSRSLNTEQGVVVDSAALAAEICGAVDQFVLPQAYNLQLSSGGSIRWHTGPDGESFSKEPGTRLWQRVLLRILARLPIDWML